MNAPKEIEAFFKTIAADPLNLSVRLIFADWLEDHSEPWAAYVRAAITLATDDLKPAECAELTSLASVLYWKHHRYWNGQVYRQWIGTPLSGKGAHANGLRGWQYRRGFPEILDVNADCFVAHAELFLGAAPFREVILRRPPQPLTAFLNAHESILIRLEKVILPTAALSDTNEVSRLPAGLAQRIRIGLREQRTVPEYVRSLPNARVVARFSLPADATPTEVAVPAAPAPGNGGTQARPPAPQSSERGIQGNPTRSVVQTLRDFWKRLGSRP